MSNIQINLRTLRCKVMNYENYPFEENFGNLKTEAEKKLAYNEYLNEKGKAIVKSLEGCIANDILLFMELAEAENRV